MALERRVSSGWLEEEREKVRSACVIYWFISTRCRQTTERQVYKRYTRERLENLCGTCRMFLLVWKYRDYTLLLCLQLTSDPCETALCLLQRGLENVTKGGALRDNLIGPTEVCRVGKKKKCKNWAGVIVKSTESQRKKHASGCKWMWPPCQNTTALR